MATVNFDPTLTNAVPIMSSVSSDDEADSHPSSDQPSTPKRRKLHRIREVREEQEMSLRSVARNLGADIRQLRIQEQESCDLRLSELYKWQKALNVPIADLLAEPDAFLSRPVSERAKMVRIMKTAATIFERADTPALKRLSQMLVEQLVDLMPELEEVGAWHEVGQRRGLNDMGRVVERRISEDSLWSSSDSYD